VPKVVIASIMNRFEEPLPWPEVRQLERDLALGALAATRGIQFLQASATDIVGLVRKLQKLPRRSTLVVLTPHGLRESKALMEGMRGVDCVAFHQSLEPCRNKPVREFRLGAWSRIDKHRVAEAWMKRKGMGSTLHIGDEPPLFDVPHLTIDPNNLAEVERSVAMLPAGAMVFLEAGGELNRMLCDRLRRDLRFVFLNGNPPLGDATLAGRCVEIVSNLPERLGAGISSLLARVRPNGGAAEREVAGMLAWRLDAVEIIRCAVVELKQRRHRVSPTRIAERVSSYDGSARVFHGLHRPLWFDVDGKNLNRELVLASPDGLGGRRALDLQPRIASEVTLEPTLDVDVDLVNISGVDAAAGTFRAEAVVRVRSCDPLHAESLQDCLRIINASGEGHWTPISPDIDGSSSNSLEAIVRGEFAFEPRLQSYPFDRQVLSIRLAASGRHASRVLRPIDGAADIDCRTPGWLVVGPHRAVTADGRPTAGGSARVVSGMEFGIHVVRGTDEIKRRVAFPLAIIVGLSMAIALADGGDDWRNNQPELLTGLFLAAVALYFSEPRPAPGVRTIVDAVFVRVFLFISVLLLALLVSIHYPQPWPWLQVGGVIAALVACGVSVARTSSRTLFFGRALRRRR